jgi:hypothetical protein
MGATKTIVTRAIKDSEFRRRLLENPKEAVQKDLGIELPANVTLRVHENSSTVINIVLPAIESDAGRALSDADLAEAAGGVVALSLEKQGKLPKPGSSVLTPLPGRSSPIAADTFGAYSECCSGGKGLLP